MKTRSILGKVFLGFCLCIYLVFIDSCKKGDTGPMGPAGVEGVQGTDGKDGEKGDKGDRGATGDKGDPGNANVDYTAWKKYTDWSVRGSTFTENTARSLAGNTIIAKRIELPIGGVDNAAVFVYIKFDNFSINTPIGPHSLPDEIKFSIPGHSGRITLRYHFGFGRITVYAVLTEGTWDAALLANNFLSQMLLRVVVVEGNNLIETSSVIFSSYPAVQRAFSIND